MTEPCGHLVQVCEEPPWQQLATATHLTHQAPTQDSDSSRPHIEAWEQALERNEIALLQWHIQAALQTPGQCSASLRCCIPSSCFPLLCFATLASTAMAHLHASLARGMPASACFCCCQRVAVWPGTASNAEQRRLSEVLMADWVMMHQSHPWLRPDLLLLAKQVCMQLVPWQAYASSSCFTAQDKHDGWPMDSAVAPHISLNRVLWLACGQDWLIRTVLIWQP